MADEARATISTSAVPTAQYYVGGYIVSKKGAMANDALARGVRWLAWAGWLACFALDRKTALTGLAGAAAFVALHSLRFLTSRAIWRLWPDPTEVAWQRYKRERAATAREAS